MGGCGGLRVTESFHILPISLSISLRNFMLQMALTNTPDSGQGLSCQCFQPRKTLVHTMKLGRSSSSPLVPPSSTFSSVLVVTREFLSLHSTDQHPLSVRY